MPQVIVIAAGGTISLTRDAQTGQSVPTLRAADFCANTTLDTSVAMQWLDAPVQPGSSGRPESLLQFARFLQTVVDSTVDGVVVIQGTDSMEEVAYFIDEVIKTDVPIVFTGAMRPSWAAGYDGPRNIENAVRIALAVSDEYGTLVTLNDEIFPAWSVYKADTGALNAFAVRCGSAFGRIFGDQVFLTWKPLPYTRCKRIPETLPSSVPILMMGIVDDAILLESVLKQPVQGVVIAAMAAGTMPPIAYQRVLALARQGIPIVVCSSAASGRTAEGYYYPKAYDDLRTAGVTIEDWLSPRKARMRLMLSLGLQEPYRPFGKEFLQSFAKRSAPSTQ